MERIIEAIRLMIHRQDFEHVEEWFVEKTAPLYRALIFSILGFVALIIIGAVFNVNGYKGINMVFMAVCLTVLGVIVLYARYIFRIALAGTAYGVAKSQVSGLQGGADFLKKYFSAVITIALVIAGIFGALTIIDFTTTSLTIAMITGIVIGLGGLKSAL